MILNFVLSFPCCNFAVKYHNKKVVLNVLNCCLSVYEFNQLQVEINGIDKKACVNLLRKISLVELEVLQGKEKCRRNAI